jgi:hypothetical protein
MVTCTGATAFQSVPRKLASVAARNPEARPTSRCRARWSDRCTSSSFVVRPSSFALRYRGPQPGALDIPGLGEGGQLVLAQLAPCGPRRPRSQRRHQAPARPRRARRPTATLPPASAPQPGPVAPRYPCPSSCSFVRANPATLPDFSGCCASVCAPCATAPSRATRPAPASRTTHYHRAARRRGRSVRSSAPCAS